MSALHLFISSYTQSDGFGKLIFWALLFTSSISWALIIYKWYELRAARRDKLWIQNQWSAIGSSLFCIQDPPKQNPYAKLYAHVRDEALAILRKNERGGKARLTKADIDSVATYSAGAINEETKRLSKYLFILSLIVTLAPFMGLLGTVWGILLAFAELQGAGSSMRETVLSGLATALSTTVLGLIVAIPALIANSFLNDSVRDIEHDLEQNWTRLISTLDLQYRSEHIYATA